MPQGPEWIVWYNVLLASGMPHVLGYLNQNVRISLYLFPPDAADLLCGKCIESPTPFFPVGLSTAVGIHRPTVPQSAPCRYWVGQYPPSCLRQSRLCVMPRYELHKCVIGCSEEKSDAEAPDDLRNGMVRQVVTVRRIEPLRSLTGRYIYVHTVNMLPQ